MHPIVIYLKEFLLTPSNHIIEFHVLQSALEDDDDIEVKMETLHKHPEK